MHKSEPGYVHLFRSLDCSKQDSKPFRQFDRFKAVRPKQLQTIVFQRFGLFLTMHIDKLKSYTCLRIKMSLFNNYIQTLMNAWIPQSVISSVSTHLAVTGVSTSVLLVINMRSPPISEDLRCKHLKINELLV